MNADISVARYPSAIRTSLKDRYGELSAPPGKSFLSIASRLELKLRGRITRHTDIDNGIADSPENHESEEAGDGHHLPVLKTRPGDKDEFRKGLVSAA
jgi:hypothetical protein